MHLLGFENLTNFAFFDEIFGSLVQPKYELKETHIYNSIYS